jgi:chromosome segregation protein
MTDAETLVRDPRLTRLEIQGFKSFLNRTVYAFEPGITAIVGPNGSGKSNVADAVRWVLGEQGQHALRAKKTEDVIFAGGQGRAPAGMAEATLTFDNSEGWLPSEFTEVAVTRRAYRSGENQYLINGRRVRLKDVAQLTAGLGQSHVVVGQGLVDAALSLRAEERRGLFEHAADLAGLRLKVAEAERSLAETDANTARLNDLLLELEPRLKGLERAARQATQWQTIRDRLRELHGAHYRAVLQAALSTLDTAQHEADYAAAAVAAARSEVERMTADGAEASARLQRTRETLIRHDERLAAQEDRLRRQTHERDLAAARVDALGKRRTDMDDTRVGLDERVASVLADLERLGTELRELERATGEAREAVGRHHRETVARREERAAIDTRLASAAAELIETERQTGELLRRRAVLIERGEFLTAEGERLRGAIAERAERIAVLTADAAKADAALAEDAERCAALDRQLADAVDASETAARKVAARRAEVDRLRRQRYEAATRLDVLHRLREGDAGVQTGVQAILAAARDGRLGGVRGTVGEFLVVPPALEVAIDAALGDRYQDVVVATWGDAEAAIADLQVSGAGRATFQPLDTVRVAAPANLPDLPGIEGVAADLVAAAPGMEVVVSALFGRTLVAVDLSAARAAMPSLPEGWRVVTRDGEVVWTSGAVTGGAATNERSALGRDRELRELPEAIAALDARLGEAETIAAQAEHARQVIGATQRATEGEGAALQAVTIERQQQRQRLASWLDALRAEQERSAERQDELVADAARAARDRSALEREIARLEETRALVTRNHDTASAELVRLTAAVAETERAVAEEGRRLAGLEERLRGERRREASLRAQERALAEELALRTERTAALDRERQTLVAEHARLIAAVDAGTTELAAETAEREPLRVAATDAENAAARLVAALDAARAALVEREREADHAGFALERARQELEIVRERIGDDLDLAQPDDVLTWAVAESSISRVEREAEIARLRERLRRVGYVGDDAVADYEREAARNAFLREQLADVEGAAAALRELLADLRVTMRTRFDETFARVAEAFAEAFAQLFGGGTARLVLTGENGGEPGIDIIAQPPGKRLQSLALLSGGERALTAAALLFAILKVNPVPFCLLDEVDAALDEANIVRFREQLQELARQTQIIVVTHNRGTIEIADTLYGVSMGADGVSQVLSLRLSESLPAD